MKVVFSLSRLSLVLLLFFCLLTRASSRKKHYISESRARYRRQLTTSARPYVAPPSSLPGWGEWGKATACSRPCGGGVASQTRSCQVTSDNVNSSSCRDSPQKRYFSCNIQSCPAGSVDFRAEQCARFDRVPFEGKYYKWVPYSRSVNQCELNCQPRGERFYYRHSSSVVDGTRCGQHNMHVCVDGSCMEVGCDGKLGSSLKEDLCGRCGGDGSDCYTARGVFSNTHLQPGYNDILFIPKGATNIKIEEVKPSNNYLALRNTSGYYHLNGNWRIDYPSSFECAGTTFIYERVPFQYSTPESIKAIGPTTEILYVVLLFQEQNAGISYEYSVPRSVRASSSADYHWTYSHWSHCSRMCGGGTRVRTVQCTRQKHEVEVPEQLCDSLNKPQHTEQCNEITCTARWSVGEWRECVSECEGVGLQRRALLCLEKVTEGVTASVNLSVCEERGAGERPETLRRCSLPSYSTHPPVYHVGQWSPCDRICGEGRQKRVVVCYRNTSTQQQQQQQQQHNDSNVVEDWSRQVVPVSRCSRPVPASSRACLVRPCAGTDWVTSHWQQCGEGCGSLVQTRTVLCSDSQGTIYPHHMCQASRKPPSSRPCSTGSHSQCNYFWVAGQWSQCSLPCGRGVKTRGVWCVSSNLTVNSNNNNSNNNSNNVSSLRIVDDSLCAASVKFNDTTQCDNYDAQIACPAVWMSSAWSICSGTCINATQSRVVFCSDGREQVPVSRCNQSDIPFSLRQCTPQSVCEEPQHSDILSLFYKHYDPAKYICAVINKITDETSTDQTSTVQTSTDQTSTYGTSTDQTSIVQTSTDQTSTDQTSTDQTSTDQTSTDQTSTDQTSTDQTSTDQTSTDQTSTAQTSTDQTSTYGTSTDQTSTDQTPTDQTSTYGTSTDQTSTDQTSTYGTSTYGTSTDQTSTDLTSDQTSTYGTSTDQTSTYGTSTYQTSTYGTSTDQTSTDQTSTYGTSTDQTSTDQTSTDQTSTYGTSTDQTSTDQTSTYGTSTDQTSTDQTSTYGTSTDQTSTDQTSTDQTSTYGTSTDQTSAVQTSTDQTSTDQTSTDQTSTDQTSTYGTSTDQTSTDQTSTYGTSTDQTSSDQTLIVQTSTDQTSTDQTSTYGTSTDQTSTDQTSTDQTSTYGTSTYGTSTDQTSTDQTSTDQTSTYGTSTDQTSTDQTSTDQTSSDQTSTDQTSTAQTSTDQTSTDQTSTDQTSTDQTSTYGTSTDQTSTDQTSTYGTSTDQTSSDQTLIVQTSTDQTSTDQTSTYGTSTDQTSTDQTSTDQTSTDQTSTAQTSNDQTSTDQTSIVQTSTDQTSIDQTSTDQTSTYGTSTDQTSTDQTPTDQTSTYGTSTDQTSTDQTSTYGTSTYGTSTDQTSTDLTSDQTSTYGTSTDQTSTYGTSTYQTSTYGTSTDQTSTDQTSTYGTSTDQTSTDQTSTDQTSTYGTSTDQTSTDQTSTYGTSTDQTSTDQTSTYGTSTDQTSTDQTSTDQTSTYGTSTDQTSAVQTSTDQTSTDQTSTDQTSTDQTSTYGTSTDQTSTDQTSTYGTSTDQTSSDQTLIVQTSTDQTSTDQTSTYGTSTDQTSTDQTSTDQTSTYGTSTYGTSTDQTSTDQTSTDQTSTYGTSTDQTSTDQTSTDQTSSDQTSTDQTSTAQTSTDQTSTDQTSTDQTSTDQTSTYGTSTDQTSTDQTSTYGTSTDQTSSDQTLIVQTSTDQTSTDQTSTYGTSTDQTSTDQTSTDQTSTDQTSTAQTSNDQTSTDQTSIVQTSTDQTSIDQTSTDQTSTYGTSTDQTSTDQTSTVQKSTYGTSTDQTSTVQTSTYGTSTDQTSTYGTSTDQTSTDQTSTDQTSSDQISTDQTSNDQTSNDQTSTDQTFTVETSTYGTSTDQTSTDQTSTDQTSTFPTSGQTSTDQTSSDLTSDQTSTDQTSTYGTSTNLPETSTNLPETSTNLPETSTNLPETSTNLPETSTNLPVSSLVQTVTPAISSVSDGEEGRLAEETGDGRAQSTTTLLAASTHVPPSTVTSATSSVMIYTVWEVETDMSTEDTDLAISGSGSTMITSDGDDVMMRLNVSPISTDDLLSLEQSGDSSGSGDVELAPSPDSKSESSDPASIVSDLKDALLEEFDLDEFEDGEEGTDRRKRQVLPTQPGTGTEQNLDNEEDLTTTTPVRPTTKKMSGTGSDGQVFESTSSMKDIAVSDETAETTTHSSTTSTGMQEHTGDESQISASTMTSTMMMVELNQNGMLLSGVAVNNSRVNSTAVVVCHALHEQSSAELSCDLSVYGCCADGLTTAQGAFSAGCVQVTDCRKTKYGCCPDRFTPSTSLSDSECPVVVDCLRSFYGCCSDNFTEKLDEEGRNCPRNFPTRACEITRFGCCDSSDVAASDVVGTGCAVRNTSSTSSSSTSSQSTPSNYTIPTSNCSNSTGSCCVGVNCTQLETPPPRACVQSQFGCCENMRTSSEHLPAHGPHQLGCCSSSQFGCCTDHITTASGPNYQGCPCTAECCADNNNNNNTGCDCENSLYGCCPDQLTSAEGPDLSGCPCHTFPYGCCPDQITPATRPDKQGCGCESGEYGCCEDGQTVAMSVDKTDCSCAASQYGCCPDGVSSAAGPQFSGCQRRIKQSGEICSLPEQQGSCRNFSVRWYFDTEYGDCSRFWYGGCEGNDNSFDTVQQCRSVCGQPADPLDACALPPVKGACEGYYVSWFFNRHSARCETFVYGGCLGNANRFSSAEQCQQHCITPRHTDVCQLSSARGPCEGNYSRWYYDTNSLQCEKFLYGGCAGNANNFPSQQVCMKRCNSARHNEAVCSQQVSVGSCSKHEARWFYNPAQHRCIPFYYSGCEGNDNNFPSEQQCLSTCLPQIAGLPTRLATRTTTQLPDETTELSPGVELPAVCLLRVEPGPCRVPVSSWYFDYSQLACVGFTYGGCAGNENKFVSEEQCERACGPARLQDACSVSPSAGDCHEDVVKWYFDYRDSTCRAFKYSGCGGTANRFDSEEECHSLCIDSLELNVADISSTFSSARTVESSTVSSIQAGSSMIISEQKYNNNNTLSHHCLSHYTHCQQIQCPFGVEHRVDERLCERCSCYNPCAGVQCSPDHNQRCAVLYSKQRGTLVTSATCRNVTKNGQCSSADHNESCDVTQPECRDDADCRNNLKCCHDGCVMRCLVPRGHTERTVFTGHVTTQTPLHHSTEPGRTNRPGAVYISRVRQRGHYERVPYTDIAHGEIPARILSVDVESTADEGSVLTLSCVVEGVPAVRVSWSHNSRPILVDRGRFRLERNGSLTIVGVSLEDAGQYTCSADNALATPDIRHLQVSVLSGRPRAADILPSFAESPLDGVVTELGSSAVLRCLAYGWPRPSVTWWRNQALLPVSSRHMHVRSDHALLVTLVQLHDLGPYTCQVYNGRGRAVTHTVLLRATAGPASSPTTTTYSARDQPFLQYLIATPTTSQNMPTDDDVTSAVSQTKQPANTLSVSIHMNRTKYTVNSDIRIPCDVKSSSEQPSVISWFKNGLPISQSEDRVQAVGAELLIMRARLSDSARYKCMVEMQGLVAEASTIVRVHGVLVGVNCTDNPYFANCQLIVAARYCDNTYYAKFCCRSCTVAGQLTSHHVLPSSSSSPEGVRGVGISRATRGRVMTRRASSSNHSLSSSHVTRDPGHST